MKKVQKILTTSLSNNNLRPLVIECFVMVLVLSIPFIYNIWMSVDENHLIEGYGKLRSFVWTVSESINVLIIIVCWFLTVRGQFYKALCCVLFSFYLIILVEKLRVDVMIVRNYFYYIEWGCSISILIVYKIFKRPPFIIKKTSDE